MKTEKIDTLVVGAGQAGIAASEHLGIQNVPHLVIERQRVAEAWRSRRWDSLVANGPAWHDRFPNLEFQHDGPDAFVSKENVADYLCDYAKRINAPVRTGVDVIAVERNVGQKGFTAQTSDGVIQANNIVVATGAFQNPVIPPVVPQHQAIQQLHSIHYKNPEQLADGGVLVVGSGSSGSQIADELQRAGRNVYLSVGPHDRPPRAYRNRDFCWWLGVLGLWDIAAMSPGTEHVTIAVSGAYGGHTMDFRRLGNAGVTLLGKTESFANGSLFFGDDLQQNVANGDASYLKMLDDADNYVERYGIELPEEPAARDFEDDPVSLSHPVRELNLVEAGISNIIWATGFAQDFSWLKVDAFDDSGKPQHQRGVSGEPGVYFLGLPWQSRRGSTFIWGVWHDAKYVVDQIVNQQKYQNYRASNE